MTSVEKELRRCLYIYPSIFMSKWDVYHHWFCINGNGYSWIDGELVENNPEGQEYDFTDLKEAVTFLLDKCLSIKSITETTLKDLKRKVCNHVLPALKIEERCEDFTPRFGATLVRESVHEPYHEEVGDLSKYSQISNIPDNVKPDWLNAAVEMQKWLEKNSGLQSEGTKKQIKINEKRIQELCQKNL